MEKVVNEKLSSGRYQTAAQVLAEALRVLQERDADQERKLADLRRDLQHATDQLERGEYWEYDADTIKQLGEEVKTAGIEGLAKEPKPGTR
jgi:antitoxin ParD1/3/4